MVPLEDNPLCFATGDPEAPALESVEVAVGETRELVV